MGLLLADRWTAAMVQLGDWRRQGLVRERLEACDRPEWVDSCDR